MVVEFKLLGPLEVWVGGRPVALTADKPRTLVTALAIDANRVVTFDRLVDVIWGENPPGSARAVIQTYVSQLRRLFREAGAGDVVVSHPVGYQLRVEPGSTDREQFENLSREGRRAATADGHQEAVDLYSSALALWRGAALEGVGESVLSSEGARLDDLRLTVIEQRIASELALGLYEQVVGELTALTSRYPTRERLRGYLMLALYRLGRQTDALAQYRQGRQVLLDDLGIEPGTELRALHDAILQSDDTVLGHCLDRPPPATKPPERPRIAPAQMPPTVPDFTGRAQEIAAIASLLAADAPTRICVLSGPGGSGKSALAVHSAHSLADQYPDGQLFVDLRGTSEAPADPFEVLGRILRQLGATPPDSLPERIADYRSMLSGQRILLVMDDAQAEQQIRPLLPGSPSCGVLVTSRSRLAAVAGSTLIELELLTPDESVGLLTSVIGVERVSAEPAAAQRIVRQCGQLPLAVRIAGARLASRRTWSLSYLADRLDNERLRLDELAIGDQAVRASIGLSYRSLAEIDQRALRLLGLMGLPTFPAWVVATLVDRDPGEGEQLVERLIDAQLVEVEGVDRIGHLRYRLHDLVRIFAWDRAEQDETTQQRAAAVVGVLGRWLWLLQEMSAGSGRAVDRSLAIPLDPRSAQPVLTNSLGWFDVEQDALVHGVELAGAMDLDEIAVQLASALRSSIFVSHNLFDAWTRTHTAALATTRRLGNVHGEATLLAELGGLSYEQDNFAAARDYFGQALSMFRSASNRRAEASALTGLGLAYREQGYLSEALTALGRAGQISRELPDEAGSADILRVIGTVRLEQGGYRSAWQALTDALRIYRGLGSRRGEAMTVHSVALYHRARGELESADASSHEALAIFRETGDRLMTAYALRTLAKTRIRRGRRSEARGPAEEALATCEAMGDRFGAALALRTLGELDLAEGRYSEAGTRLEEYLRQCAELGLPLWRARGLRDLAAVLATTGRTEQADAALAEAIGVFRAYGAREYDELRRRPEALLKSS